MLQIRAVNIINAYTRGYLVRRLMRTERVITLKKVYKEALQCMLKLHVDAPLNLAEVDFLHRLQLQVITILLGDDYLVLEISCKITNCTVF